MDTPSFPSDLQARLDAAGVTDAESFPVIANEVKQSPSPSGEMASPSARHDNLGDALTVGNVGAGAAVAAGAGAQASSINYITNIGELHFERRWSPPPPPALADVVERKVEADAVLQLLNERGTVTIGSRAVAVQGMAGIGKTTLAKILAHRLHGTPDYPDGVIWTDVGPDKRQPDDAQPILNLWATYAVGVPLGQAWQFAPSVVRALFAEHPRLLVILDNVWSLDAIKPLHEALPPAARLIVTTRSRDVMRGLHGGVYELDKLSVDDARALLRMRLRLSATDDVAWADALLRGLAYHALALDVAFGLLAREGDTPRAWAETAHRLLDHAQHDQLFRRLKLSDDDREHNVEAVLAFSYRAMSAAAQQRFRALGVFALDAEFETRFAAQVWQCDAEDARQQLNEFVNAALVGRGVSDPSGFQKPEGSLWRQHSLLRGYALALLRDAGEHEAIAARHAAAYDEAMRVADDAQQYYLMRPALPQLRHAFAWAIVQDLSRAQSLIANCFELQSAFGLAHENLARCEQALQAAQARGTEADVARAHVSLGNALSQVATLPNEDRRARLYAALAAYDEALKFRRPDTAPLDYAATQNNRATILGELATLPNEDRRARLYAALAAYDEALQHYRPDSAPLYYAGTQNNRATILGELATLPNEDRRARLGEALRVAWEAFTMLGVLQHAQYQQTAANVLRDLRLACGADFDALWNALGVGACPAWLTAVSEYDARVRAAAQNENDVSAWQSAIDAGEALPAEEFRALDGVNWDVARADLASNYNSLGNAHSQRNAHEAALAAYDRAIALQPDFAMWQRNRAGMLIALKRLDEARAAIARARALEPDAARLKELDEKLAKAVNSEP